ncbi:aspartate/glutamate racemase family protein [Cupriavidus taiwanensis]|uniref:aspartate/glutamate racemase family protein n=1 Tax=Cupriavidus taiwanensis TaxID=164546 RepID=UPI000E18498C|nr:aspartate/glutamate racemase family protein [Cupriavidus taiwanensis]SOZ24474.1 putative Hydantoin racemase [Cupriavidus taiwanensis]SPA29345.1 putative Hydantoin racemase [Cupriavidus taiwanensis]SPA45966.1 putative Hydantoin racemase [Cupriavidus taiwanensis]
MSHILLINPNTSGATTQMMVGIARAWLAQHMAAPPPVVGATVARGAPMIVDDGDLAVAAGAVNDAEMVRLAGLADGVIVGAFGDPGLEALRAQLAAPVVGIGEAAMRAAAAGERRFGVATTTPRLAASIEAGVHRHELAAWFTGARFTDGDPRALGNAPRQQEQRLAGAVQACIDDGAQAVIIGGGPLGEAARALGQRFAIPVIGPIPAACEALARALGLAPAAAAAGA